MKATLIFFFFWQGGCGAYVKDFISLLLGIYFLLTKYVLHVHPLAVTSVVIIWSGDLETPNPAFCDVLASKCPQSC